MIIPTNVCHIMNWIFKQLYFPTIAVNDEEYKHRSEQAKFANHDNYTTYKYYVQ